MGESDSSFGEQGARRKNETLMARSAALLLSVNGTVGQARRLPIPSNGKRERLPYKSVIGGQRSENDEARMVRAGLALNDEGMKKPE